MRRLSSAAPWAVYYIVAALIGYVSVEIGTIVADLASVELGVVAGVVFFIAGMATIVTITAVWAGSVWK